MMTNEEMERKLGEVLEFLNQKADLDMQNIVVPENYDYVIETKLPTEEDPSWYRLYKSGWVEQGGKATTNAETVTFLKSFKDNNYGAQVTPLYHSVQPTFNWSITNKTTTNMIISSADGDGTTNRICDWEAKGMSDI